MSNVTKVCKYAHSKVQIYSTPFTSSVYEGMDLTGPVSKPKIPVNFRVNGNLGPETG
jgi:hypothetical protein